MDHDEIEKTFQRIEDEMEARARKQAREEAARGLVVTSRVPIVSSTEAPGAEAANVVQKLPANGGDTLRSIKQRRRGSISISRLGQQDPPTTVSPPSSPSPYSTLQPPSTASSRGPSPKLVVQHANGSNTSLASAASSATDRSDHHTTQKETLAPKKSVARTLGRVITRRLTVSRSASPLTSQTAGSIDDVVIGVRVETQERDSADANAEGDQIAPGAHVVAGDSSQPRTIRHKSSNASSQSSGRKGWNALGRLAAKLIPR